jgi:hypothetical protein
LARLPKKRESFQRMHHEGSIALFRYWNGLRGNRPAPRRTEIEPAEIKSLLADTMILERDTRGEAVFRLAGTRLCATYGRELKGYSFPLIWAPRDQRSIARLVRSAFSDSSVIVVTFQGTSSTEKTLGFEMILLPLEGGLSNSRCLGAITPATRPYWLGAEPIVENRIDTIKIIDPDNDMGSLPPRALLSGPSLQPGLSQMLRHTDRLDAQGRRIRHLVVFDGGRDS